MTEQEFNDKSNNLSERMEHWRIEVIAAAQAKKDLELFRAASNLKRARTEHLKLFRKAMAQGLI